MNAAQQAKYFYQWGQLREVLRARGLTSAQCEQHRHEITRKALGVDKSSKDFTNADLDAVLAKIAAERDPAGFAAQMALQDSPDNARAAIERRTVAALEVLVGHEANRSRYLDGTARKICGRFYADCTDAQRAKIMGALERSARVRLACDQRQADKEAEDAQPKVVLADVEIPSPTRQLIAGEDF
jgi:hypothetical protein